MPYPLARKAWEVDKDGNAPISPGPGLGVGMDEAKIAEVKADPKNKNTWPVPKGKDDAVIDDRATSP